MPPATHMEMFLNAESMGRPGSPPLPDMVVTAYPAMVDTLMNDDGDLCEELPPELPPMRSDLRELGMAEPVPFMRVVAVVPLLLIHNLSVEPPRDWADLCRPPYCDSMAVPPLDTPMPALFDALMTALCGDEASHVLAAKNTSHCPLDINKLVDRGDFAVGLSIPAFARTFRNNGAAMVWPASGAWAVPLVACVRKGCHPDALKFLAYLLSEEYQTYLAQTGCLVPVREGIDFIPEMKAAGDKLFWAGWDRLRRLRVDPGQETAPSRTPTKEEESCTT